MEGQVVETGLLGPARYDVLQRWHLKPGENKRVVVGTLPEAGSNYPVALILRTPPGR